MSAGLAFGLTLTAVAVVAFLVWTRHEVGRVDDVIDEVDERFGGGDQQ